MISALPFRSSPGGILGEILRSRKRTDPAAPPSQKECDPKGLTIRDFEPLQLVALRCSGDLDHVGRAWQYLYRIWLPTSAYEPADLPAMEMFVRLPEEIGWETFDLQIGIPVVGL